MSMNAHFCQAAIAGLLLAAATECLTAAPITFVFEGRLASVQDMEGELDPSVVSGAPFAVSFQYDPTRALDELPDDTVTGQYSIDSRFRVRMGTSVFANQAFEVYVRAFNGTEPPGGEVGCNPHAPPFPDCALMSGSDFIAGINGGDDQDPIQVEYMFISLKDSDWNAFQNDYLPRTFELLEFDEYRTFQFGANGGNVRVYGEIESLRIIPAPRPCGCLDTTSAHHIPCETVLVFEGEVETIFDSGDDLQGSIIVGERFVGRFSYDPCRARDENADPDAGQYTINAPFRLLIGDHSISSSSFGIGIKVQHGAEPSCPGTNCSPHHPEFPCAPCIVNRAAFTAGTDEDFEAGDWLVDHVFMTLQDPEADAFETDALPRSLSLDQFGGDGGFHLGVFTSNGYASIEGRVTSLKTRPRCRTLGH